MPTTITRKGQHDVVKQVWASLRNGAEPVICAVILAFLITIVADGASRGWRSLDRSGWIPHRQVTRVWFTAEQPWTIGEYADCTASPKGGMLEKRGSPGIDLLVCARSSEWESNQNRLTLAPQELQVTYWGRIAIPYPESEGLYSRILTTPDSAPYYKRPFRWRCRHNESSVVCWAIN